MSDVRWIGRADGERTAEDAVGYVSEMADKAEAILVLVKRPDGGIDTRSFGNFTVRDTALVATLLGYQVATQMYEDGDVE